MVPPSRRHQPEERTIAAPPAPDALALQPLLLDLHRAVAEAHPYLGRAAAVRGRVWVNHEGGDVAGHGSDRSLVRHLTNYVAAAELAEHVGVRGPMADVGSGVGAFAAWLAARLGSELHLVDRDPSVRRVAGDAFPVAGVHAELDALQPRSMALVTAMEVVEHVEPTEQLDFVRGLYSRLSGDGLMVLSTPDESAYLGGWSGYAPHVGCLAPAQLQALLEHATGRPAVVWRLEGWPFHVGPLRRVLHPLANRAWGLVSGLVPRVATQIGRVATSVSGTVRRAHELPVVREVRARPVDHGTGSGLIGAVRASG